ncbi:Uncharacterised protein [uncultured archaeon]|nr:Uncharacterised protein [uncultured archaeon]
MTFVNGDNALKRGFKVEDLAMSFFERRVCDLVIRLQKEQSSKISFSTYRRLVSYCHFTKLEATQLLPLLEARGLITISRSHGIYLMNNIWQNGQEQPNSEKNTLKRLYKLQKPIK